MIVSDCEELANFQNMLPSCVCKKWCLFTACCCAWRHSASLRKTQQCPSYALLSRHDGQRWVFVWAGKLALCSSLNSALEIQHEEFFFFFSLPLWDCLWMDGLASLFSKFWDCQTCTFSKQINSASVENIMVHFPNSCGRQASYARVELRIHFAPVFILRGVVKKKGLITGFSPVRNLAGFMLIL